MKRNVLLGVLLAIGSLFCSSCTDDVQSEFSSIRAFLRISPVTALPPLQKALNNPGLFCTLTYTSTQYLAALPNESPAPLDRLADEVYGRPQSIAGFIVGTPSVTDLKTGQFYQVCFDLTCPTCFDNEGIQRRLTLHADEVASCGRCNRVYSLRNKGIVVEGEAGSLLKRYNFSYGNNTFVVNN